MTDKFDIIEYLSGLTGFVFDKAVLKRIAYDRDVWCTHDYAELSEEQKDLLRADLLYTAYISPNVWASSSHSHGSYTKSIGAQTLYEGDRERLYNIFSTIYTKYKDAALEEITDTDSTVQFIDVF